MSTTYSARMNEARLIVAERTVALADSDVANARAEVAALIEATTGPTPELDEALAVLDQAIADQRLARYILAKVAA